MAASRVSDLSSSSARHAFTVSQTQTGHQDAVSDEIESPPRVHRKRRTIGVATQQGKASEALTEVRAQETRGHRARVS